MKPIPALYLKSFLVFGLPFSILMWMADFTSGQVLYFWKYLAEGFMFGALMSITLVTIQVASLKSKGVKDFTDENLKVIQRQVIQSGLTRDGLITRLENDKNFRKMKVATDANGLKITTPASWQSMGETIAVNVTPIHPGMNEFEIISKPKLGTTILDFGKNLENVRRIERLVTVTD
jgi:hypothetical protein